MNSKPRTKAEKSIAIARAWPILGTLPCGCVPRIVPCRCPETACRCPIEVELCGCAREDDERGVRQREWDRVEARLGKFLETADPENYAERPADPFASPITSRDNRIRVMSERHTFGMEIFHPDDLRIGDENLKIGERISVNANGSLNYLGITEETNA